MEFKIETWEVPPGVDANQMTVPIEFGPVEWNGAQTLISARWLELPSGEALAFFRPHMGGMNFVVTREDGTALPVAKKHVNSKRLGQIVRAAPEERQSYFGRIFYCEGECLTFRDGCGHWSSQDFWQKEKPLRIPFDAMTEPSSRVFGWLQNQWRDANSQVRFSWEWARKSESQRDDWLGDVVPHWRELGQLMRAVAISVQLPPGARWILDHFDSHNHTPELLARLQPWRELLIKHFVPFSPLPDSYPQFLRDYFRFASGHVEVVGETTSAHQRLEAQLHLRQWLRQHAPDRLDLLGELGKL